MKQIDFTMLIPEAEQRVTNKQNQVAYHKEAIEKAEKAGMPKLKARLTAALLRHQADLDEALALLKELKGGK